MSNLLDLDDTDEAKSSSKIKIYPTFNSMSLKEELLKGIYSFGFEKPSLIQRKAIRQIIEGHDVIAQSQSGSGKTATFSIGILNQIRADLKQLQALVLAPTRELAAQIHKVISSLSGYMSIRCLSACGGQSKGGLLAKEMKKGCQILIGTPGRILDIMRSGVILDYLHILVIDEADEMVNQGLKEQLNKIFARIPSFKINSLNEEKNQTTHLYNFNTPEIKSRLQVVVVSATLPKSCLDLISRTTTDPIKILVPRGDLSLTGIHQFYIDTLEEKWKFEVLEDIFTSVCVPQTIIFVSSRKKVIWLRSRLVKNGFSVSCAHGEMEQFERDKVMEKFRSGEGRILISTDVWARGIDIHTVGLVINYDLPVNVACYLHRIGRSGRFGRRGLGISLVAGNDDKKLLQDIAFHYKIAIPPAPKSLNSLINFLVDLKELNQQTGKLNHQNSKNITECLEKSLINGKETMNPKSKKRKRKKRKHSKSCAQNHKPDQKKLKPN